MGIRRSVQALSPYVPGAQPRPGQQVVKLNTNENPYPPAKAVAEALAAFDVEQLQRYPDPLCLELREALATVHGVGVENLFVGNGSDEVLALCSRAFVDDDGSIGFFDPSYSVYPVLADIRDVDARPIELGLDFAWTMAPGYACSLFFLANPNAPTSMLFPRDEVTAFCDRADTVVIDEAYADFASDNCLDLARTRDNVLVVRTVSKSYSLAGLRVGYAVGDAALIGALMKLKDSYNVNALSQTLALAAITHRDAMLDNARRVIGTRRRLSSELARRGYKVLPSETNFVWARPGHTAARRLFEGRKQAGVWVRHFPGERTGDYLRISIGTDEEIDALLGALDRMTKAEETDA